MRSIHHSPLRLGAILAFAIIPAAMIAMTVPAHAESARGSTEPVSVIIRHGDLDLTGPDGVAALERRIASSVKRACPTLTRDLREQVHARKCRQAAALRASRDKQVAIAAAEARRPRLAAAASDGKVSAQ